MSDQRETGPESIPLPQPSETALKAEITRLTTELQAAREKIEALTAYAKHERSLGAESVAIEALSKMQALQAKLDAAVRLVRDISVAGYCASAFLASLTEPS